MPLDPNDIAEALELDPNVGGNLATIMAIKAHLDPQIANMPLDNYGKLRAEFHLLRQMDDWRFNSNAGGLPMPANNPAWLNVANQCLVNATAPLQSELQFSAQMDVSNLQAWQERKIRHQAEAQRMDDQASGLGLPSLQDINNDNQRRVLGMAGLDKVVAAELGANDAVGTRALSSCTGVTLYDPETKVGAVMHVYEGKVTIDDALEAMKKINPDIDPSRLQVTVTPGVSEGVNTSHLESLRDQLTTAGITRVRDLSKEGRNAGEVYIKGDGTVVGDIMPPPPKLQTEAPKVETRGRSSSVGEMLGMGKHAPKQTEGIGEEVTGPETRLKRSNSEPNLKSGRKL